MSEFPLETRLENDRLEFRRNLFFALLYLISRKGQLPLPSLYEYITAELFEGLFQVSLGQPFPYPRSHRDPFFDWERKYNEVLDDLLARGRKMVELRRESVDKLLRFRWVSSPPADSYYVNEVREWMGMPYWNSMKSEFEVSARHASDAEKFLDQLFSTTREWCEQVAEYASRMVEVDLAFIREHYHW